MYILSRYEENTADDLLYRQSEWRETIEEALAFAENKNQALDVESKTFVCSAWVPTNHGSAPSSLHPALRGDTIEVLMRGDEVYLERACHDWDFSDHTFPRSPVPHDEDSREGVVILLVVAEPELVLRLSVFEAMVRFADFLRSSHWFLNDAFNRPSELTQLIVRSLEVMQDLVYSNEEFFDELLVLLDFWVPLQQEAIVKMRGEE